MREKTEIEEEIPSEAKKLITKEMDLLETEISKQELDKAPHMRKNNKSPGIDAYSPEFLKHFWPILGNCAYVRYQNKKIPLKH